MLDLEKRMSALRDAQVVEAEEENNYIENDDDDDDIENNLVP
jgi:hypothetical protein